MDLESCHGTAVGCDKDHLGCIFGFADQFYTDRNDGNLFGEMLTLC